MFESNSKTKRTLECLYSLISLLVPVSGEFDSNVLEQWSCPDFLKRCCSAGRTTQLSLNKNSDPSVVEDLSRKGESRQASIDSNCEPQPHGSVETPSAPSSDEFDSEGEGTRECSTSSTSSATAQPNPTPTSTTSSTPHPNPTPTLTSSTPHPNPTPTLTSSTPHPNPTPTLTSSTPHPNPTPTLTSSTPHPNPTPTSTSSTFRRNPTPTSTSSTPHPNPTPKFTSSTFRPNPTPKFTSSTFRPNPTPTSTPKKVVLTREEKVMYKDELTVGSDSSSDDPKYYDDLDVHDFSSPPKKPSDVKGAELCGFCQCSYRGKWYKTECGHVFHKLCLDNLFASTGLRRKQKKIPMKLAELDYPDYTKYANHIDVPLPNLTKCPCCRERVRSKKLTPFKGPPMLQNSEK